MALWKFTAREIRNRPGRALLTLLSIVIGVSAVVAVTVATGATREAYRGMYQVMTGRAQLEVVQTTSGRFEASYREVVAGVPGVRQVTPIVRMQASLRTDETNAGVMLLGVDVEAPGAWEDYRLVDGRLLKADDPGAVLVSEGFAKSLGLAVGGEVTLIPKVTFATGPRRASATIAGIVSPRGVGALSQGGVVLLPLRSAQKQFTLGDKVDALLVEIDEGADENGVRDAINGVLPKNLAADRPATRTEMADETLVASQQALNFASALSMLVAGFIILNTFLMNVSERRRQLSIMKAIGATRSQIIAMLMGEAFLMGVCGSVIGAVVGLVGAQFLMQSMERLFQASFPPIAITPYPFILAVIFGLGVSLVGAFLPARRAGRVSPLEGMRPVSSNETEGSPRWVAWGGVVMLLAGSIALAACILGYISILHSVWSAIAALVGLVLVMPVFLVPLTSAVAWLFKPVLRAESTIASRQLLRRRLRTALTVGVLFIAVATGIGMASAVLDNISDVRSWYERTLVGDFFVRAMMPDMATGQAADMPDALGEQIAGIAGVVAVDPVRFVKTEVKGPNDSFRVVVVAKEFADGQAHFDLKSGEADQILDRLKQGEIVIGTVLAMRAGLDVGDTVEIGVAKGDQPAPKLVLAGTTNDYSFGGMTVYVHRRKAEELFAIRGADAFIVKADSARLREVEASLSEICRSRGLMLQSWVELSELIDEIVAGIVGALWVILALGFIVATFGIVNTLTMNVLEQTREIGLLRVVAMTRGQIRSTILAQAAIMGVIGIVPGVLAGMGIAWLINLTTFPLVGRLLEFVFHKELILGGLLGGLAVVLLAAWLPAERAARLPLLESLRRE